MRILGLLVLLLVLPTVASAQSRKPNKPKPTQGNPIAFAWVCPGHGMHVQHELDIIEVSSGIVVSTVLLGNPPVQPNGEVLATFNVYPTEPGTYVAVVRAITIAAPSPDSEPSDAWVATSQGQGKP